MIKKSKEMVITKDGLMVTSRRVYGQGWGPRPHSGSWDNLFLGLVGA